MTYRVGSITPLPVEHAVGECDLCGQTVFFADYPASKDPLICVACLYTPPGDGISFS